MDKIFDLLRRDLRHTADYFALTALASVQFSACLPISELSNPFCPRPKSTWISLWISLMLRCEADGRLAAFQKAFHARPDRSQLYLIGMERAFFFAKPRVTIPVIQKNVVFKSALVDANVNWFQHAGNPSPLASQALARHRHSLRKKRYVIPCCRPHFMHCFVG